MENRRIEKVRNTITARDLSDYRANLDISIKFISGKKVLNFGCGGSNLKKDIAQKPFYGDGSRFVDIDIENDPFEIENIHDDSLESIKERNRRIKLKKLRDKEDTSDQLVFPIIRIHENKLLGIEDRNFIKYDGVILPFEDSQFDITLALWSTYQIDTYRQRKIFDEIIRVSKIVHIGPIDGEDLSDLQAACEKYDSEIILISDFGEDNFDKLDTIEDYRALADAEFPKFDPILNMDVNTDLGTVSANSAGAARAIIIRKVLLQN